MLIQLAMVHFAFVTLRQSDEQLERVANTLLISDFTVHEVSVLKTL